jgi:hypothetical protein
MSQMDVRHFGCHILTMDVIYFKNGCQTFQKQMSDILDVACRKWMSDILDVTFRKWMSNISKMDVRVTFQKWMSDISKMD